MTNSSCEYFTGPGCEVRTVERCSEDTKYDSYELWRPVFGICACSKNLVVSGVISRSKMGVLPLDETGLAIA